MEKHYNFSVSQNKLGVNKLIREYFCQRGFAIQSEEPNKLFFTMKRNVLLNLITANPLKWNSQVIVLRRGTEITTHANISVFKIRIPKNTDQVWDQFFANLESNLKAGLSELSLSLLKQRDND